MTVRENLSFALEMRGEFKAHIEKQVGYAAGILGLGELLDRYPRQLSGGQQQRVAMGRAIVRNPQVFLFDEPLSNLDAKLRVQMRTEIKDLHERLKTTTIYVTHDQIEAMTMADRIVVMRLGVVEQIGTPLELYDHPANSFVATFIGSPSMNLLRGKLVDVSNGPVFEHNGGQSIPLGTALSGVATGIEIDLGIRPEHLSVGDVGFAAKVVVVEPTGAETQVVADIDGQRVTAIVKDRVSIGRGDLIHLAPDIGRVHCFDAGNGQRLP
jgi:multiple sugar transport system ATP-binding protein